MHRVFAHIDKKKIWVVLGLIRLTHNLWKESKKINTRRVWHSDKIAQRDQCERDRDRWQRKLRVIHARVAAARDDDVVDTIPPTNRVHAFVLNEDNIHFLQDVTDNQPTFRCWLSSRHDAKMILRLVSKNRLS